MDVQLPLAQPLRLEPEGVAQRHGSLLLQAVRQAQLLGVGPCILLEGCRHTQAWLRRLFLVCPIGWRGVGGLAAQHAPFLAFQARPCRFLA